MTGSWSVVPAPGHHTRVKLTQDSFFGFADPAVFYFTVPAGTREFAFRLLGTHVGTFQAWAFRPDGSLGGSAAGANVSGHKLPWMKFDDSDRRVLRVKPEPVPARDEEWKLLVLTQNGIWLNVVSGIPPYLSIVPKTHEKQ